MAGARKTVMGLLALLAGLSAALPAAAFEMPPRDSFEASVQRPLFFPGRRAGPPPTSAGPAEAAAVPDVAPAGLRLIGLAVDSRGRAVAVLRGEGADGPERRVTAGDTVQGWTIESVGRGMLVLTQAERRTTVPIAGILPKAQD